MNRATEARGKEREREPEMKTDLNYSMQMHGTSLSLYSERWRVRCPPSGASFHQYNHTEAYRGCSLPATLKSASQLVIVLRDGLEVGLTCNTVAQS